MTLHMLKLFTLAVLRRDCSDTFPSTDSLLAGKLSVLQNMSVSVLGLHLLDSNHQLIQIPATDLHVALILVQTLGESLRISLAASGAPRILRVVLVGLASHSIVRLLLLSWGSRRSKHSSDSMANT